MPILGIMASQISGHLWAPDGAYDSLATVTLTASTASITFAGIPNTYKHLQIRSISKPSAISWVAMQFNSDTGLNYSRHDLRGDGSSASAEASTSTNYMLLNLYLPTPASNVFNVGVTDILDYTNTSKNTTVRTLGGTDANGSGNVDLTSGLWMNTSAVSSITLTTNNGSTLAQYSQFSLYGIK
jgi:hypothetical protein